MMTRCVCCPRQILFVPQGVSPHCAYPSAIHSSTTYLWTVELSDPSLVVRSVDFLRIISGDVLRCLPCSSLLNHNVIDGIQHWNKHGVAPNMPYKWHTMASITVVVQTKNEHINKLKLAGLNMAQSLLSWACHLEAHKCFLLAVGEGKVARLHTLVSVSQKVGNGIYSILEKINQAVQDVYHPLSYEEHDYQQLFLFHKLRGVTVADLAHHAFGLPSIKTTVVDNQSPPVVVIWFWCWKKSPKRSETAEMDPFNVKEKIGINRSLKKAIFYFLTPKIWWYPLIIR